MTHNFRLLMKFGLGLFLAGSASLMLVGCDKAPSRNSASASQDHLARIKSSGELKVGLEGDWQPFSFHNEKDQLVGYDVEVAQNLAKKLGVKAKIVEGPWDGLFAGMDTGRYDLVINGVDVTPDRAKTYDFSTPYAYDRTVLITRSDNNDIHSFNDLKGKTTANSIGSTCQEIGEKYGAKVSGVDTLAETLQMVKNRQVQATINASTSYGDYMKHRPDEPLKIAATMDKVTEYAIPMKKGEDNASLKKAIDNALQEMKNDGTLSKLSVKYFGADLTKPN